MIRGNDIEVLGISPPMHGRGYNYSPLLPRLNDIPFLELFNQTFRKVSPLEGVIAGEIVSVLAAFKVQDTP